MNQFPGHAEFCSGCIPFILANPSKSFKACPKHPGLPSPELTVLSLTEHSMVLCCVDRGHFPFASPVRLGVPRKARAWVMLSVHVTARRQVLLPLPAQSLPHPPSGNTYSLLATPCWCSQSSACDFGLNLPRPQFSHLSLSFLSGAAQVGHRYWLNIVQPAKESDRARSEPTYHH